MTCFSLVLLKCHPVISFQQFSYLLNLNFNTHSFVLFLSHIPFPNVKKWREICWNYLWIPTKQINHFGILINDVITDNTILFFFHFYLCSFYYYFAGTDSSWCDVYQKCRCMHLSHLIVHSTFLFSSTRPTFQGFFFFHHNSVEAILEI